MFVQKLQKLIEIWILKVTTIDTTDKLAKNAVKLQIAFPQAIIGQIQYKIYQNVGIRIGHEDVYLNIRNPINTTGLEHQILLY